MLGGGGVVIFPTETVYGIGADIRQPRAIERIFALKHRPPDRRLLLHLGDKSQIKDVVRDIPTTAHPLISTFLPGPLAIILYRSPAVPDIVTAGGETVGIRIVAHEWFAAVSRNLGAPIAGTSANLSGNPPTNEFAQIPSEIIAGCDLAIDAGISGSGIPSTVVDLTQKTPVILRLGEIGYDRLNPILKTAQINTGIQS